MLGRAARLDSFVATRDLSAVYLLAFLVAAVMAVASVVGLVAGGSGLYAVDETLLVPLLGQDLLNLLVGVPLLLGSAWLARRGSLPGLLLLPGAFFYVLYDYGYYVLGAPVTWLFIPYLALVTLSAYAMAGAIVSIDARVLRARLDRTTPARVVGGFLIGLAVLFTVLWTVLVSSALAGGTPVTGVVRMVVTMDLTVQLPALAVGGVLLWRRHPLGFVVAPGLLLQMIAYLAGLSALCLLGIDATGAPATPASWLPGVVVGIAGLALLWPFVRDVRAAV